jgi:hypothetical protein
MGNRQSLGNIMPYLSIFRIFIDFWYFFIFENFLSLVQQQVVDTINLSVLQGLELT